MARSAALVAVLLIAWGGCGSGSKGADEPSFDDPCGAYRFSVGPSLERLSASLDEFQKEPEGAQDMATSARRLAEAIDEELVELRQIQSEDAAIGAAHGELVGALEQAASSLGALASAFAIGDEGAYARARAQLEESLAMWTASADKLRQRCPKA